MDRVFLISDFGAIEVAAAISRSYRMRQLDELAARRALGKFDDWRIESTIQRATHADDIKTSERLIRNFQLKLSAPDAIHLAIAITGGAPMVTFDQRLAEAARSVEHPVVMPRA